MEKIKLKYCTNCLMPETRPRITFNENGVCNACSWAEEKRSQVDWASRWQQLESLCENQRKRNRSKFNVIVPVSGGKDSSYVACMVRDKLGMHPLCITIKAPLEKELGRLNLHNFIEHGFDHIHITPNPAIARVIDKKAFIDHGRPMHSMMACAQAAIFKSAILYDIPFVMWGEEGEVEYGGTTKLKNNACYDIEDAISIYLSGKNPVEDHLSDFSETQLYWWQMPTSEEMRRCSPLIAKWSYFEDWDPYKHYLVAKEKVGLQESPNRNIGTYNNYGQNDTILYDLYAYFMYLKFGFGRCSQDVGIDIRRGAMTRKQGLALVRKFDGEYPEPYIAEYLKFYDLSRKEFDSIIDKHANKKLFTKEIDKWVPLFCPE
jgi:N-acetyl sugar amidotransferase